jgi:hypothetical protein
MLIAPIAGAAGASPHIHGATAIAGWETALAIAVLIFLSLGALAIMSFGFVRQPRGRGGEDADSGPGGGGPGRRGPGGPREPQGDPAWWPEFERQFAAYVVCRNAGVT